MAEKLIILWVLVFLSNQVFSQEFVFNGFNHLNYNDISLYGSAEIENNGILRLTNTLSRVVGHAFYSSPIQLKNSTDGKAFSFSTAFAFAIVPDPEDVRHGGHGFAFAISSTKDLFGASPSKFLGLLDESDNQNFSTRFFAVEFDTVQNDEIGDIDDNHVGIDINNLKSSKSVPAAYFVGNQNSMKSISLKKSRKVIQAWIDYDSIKNQLNVRISPSSIKPNSPLLSFDVDLSLILEDFMYIGFSSSTGRVLRSYHYVLGWSFKMNGETKELDRHALPTLPVSWPNKNKKRTVLIIGVSLSSALVMIVAIGAAIIYVAKKIKNANAIEDWELDVVPHRFSYQELEQATRGFRDEDLVGFGGFGRVYKGTLPNSDTQVAVKRISHDSKQGFQEFLSEIASIGRLRHRNLVQLLGWCRRRLDLLIVYEFMPNRSLDKHLFEHSELILSWEARFKIIKGVASGLLYMHEEWEQTVIHRDIKAGNILLDSEMNGRLGDFGLAKLYEHGSNPGTTTIVGTLGYLAPELTRTGKPTTCSDVFALGALLLEVVCGRRPIDANAMPEEPILVEWVWERLIVGAILEVVDQRLNNEFDEFEVVLVLKLGLLCSNNVAERRPSMRQVVRYLEREVELPEVMAASNVSQ